jgi:hypothetical protein
LRLRNFIAFVIPPLSVGSMTDLLTHRVLITQNSEALLELAVIHEFCLIDIEHASKEPAKLADIISREWLAGSLKARQPYIARISADGSVTVIEIE